eukprot:6179930-Pleurochrysis_carterae.AAC.1
MGLFFASSIQGYMSAVDTSRVAVYSSGSTHILAQSASKYCIDTFVQQRRRARTCMEKIYSTATHFLSVMRVVNAPRNSHARAIYTTDILTHMRMKKAPELTALQTSDCDQMWASAQPARVALSPTVESARLYLQALTHDGSVTISSPCFFSLCTQESPSATTH